MNAPSASDNPARADAHAVNYREEKDLPASGAHDVMQQAGNDPAGRGHGSAYEQQSLRNDPQRAGNACSPSGEKGCEQDHRNDAQILEDQNAQRRLSMRAVDFPTIREQAQHDGGAAQRDEHPEEQRDA
jgi:hypothetical protein